jgi:hypothetical protein
MGVLLLLSSNETVAQRISTSEDTRGISLTIYNQNFAVVREKRDISLTRGSGYIRYEDVAAKIDPTSISFKSVTAPDAVAVREQNYQYDLLSPASILSKSVGKKVTYKQIRPDGREVTMSGTLLSTNSGTVFRADDGRIILNPWGEITVDELPEGLVPKPSLLWKLDCSREGRHETEVSYITNGMTWKADYVAVVTDKEDHVDVTGWVTLDNKSGATYSHAQLQLLAGDVRRVEENRIYEEDEYMMMDYAAAPEAAKPQFEEESFFEYHLYTLDGFTDVRDKETKQMTLMSANNVEVVRKLIFDGGGNPYGYRYSGGPGSGRSTEDKKVNVVLELMNSKDNNMGMPLPKGKVRVYKEDKRGNLQFLGEDLIDHTPKDETVGLYIGDAFDVVGTRKRTQYDKISSRVRDESYEVSIRNHKDEDTKVWITEHVFGDWEMVSNSHPYDKKDATTIEFPVTVPKDGEVIVKYKVRIRW